MGTLPLAAIDMDMVIGVIAVVGWIIAQILSKKGKSASPPPSIPSTGEHGQPLGTQDELRKFFQDLEKGLSGQAERPMPPPPPPPARDRPHPRHARHSEMPRSRGTVQPPSPVSLAEPSLVVMPEVLLPAPATENAQRWTKNQHKWSVGFTHPDTLRQMIVATEVLGAPLALRKPRSIPF
jgi:hypothetical protein